MLFCVLFVDVMQTNSRHTGQVEIRREPSFWVRGVSHHIGQMLWGRGFPEGPSKILGELLAAVPNFCETLARDHKGEEDEDED